MSNGDRDFELDLDVPESEREIARPSSRTPGRRTRTEALAPMRAADPAVPSSGGEALSEATQSQMGDAFGYDFSAVRTHRGGYVSELGARAFTRGSDLHFAPGEYDPEGLTGRELLGHELSHVVQQSQGRVQATTQYKGLAVNDDDALEAEADRHGALAARGGSVTGVGAILPRLTPLAASSGAAPAQGVFTHGKKTIGAEQAGAIRKKLIADKQMKKNGEVDKDFVANADEAAGKIALQAWLKKQDGIEATATDLYQATAVDEDEAKADDEEEEEPPAAKGKKGKRKAAGGKDEEAEAEDKPGVKTRASKGKKPPKKKAGGKSTFDLDDLGLGYDSDHKEEMDDAEHIKLRRAMSDLTKKELGSGDGAVDADYYRGNHMDIAYEGEHRYDSTATANLIHAKGFSVAQSAYSDVFKKATEATGSDSATSQLLLDGLFDMPKFTASLAGYDEDVQTKLRAVFSQVLNEIIGRSTSNLLEVTALLKKTVADDKDLFTRFKKYALLIPTGSEHKGIGGQKLSRIGHGTVDTDKLDKPLTKLVEKNRTLFSALMESMEAKDEDDMLAKAKPLLVAFASNIKTNTTVADHS